MYIHIYAYIYTFTIVFISVPISVYVEIHEFTPMPFILIQHYRVHSRLIPFYYLFLLWHWETCLLLSLICSLIWSMPQYETNLPSRWHPLPPMIASSFCLGSDSPLWVLPPHVRPVWALTAQAGWFHSSSAGGHSGSLGLGCLTLWLVFYTDFQSLPFVLSSACLQWLLVRYPLLPAVHSLSHFLISPGTPVQTPFVPSRARGKPGFPLLLVPGASFSLVCSLNLSTPLEKSLHYPLSSLTSKLLPISPSASFPLCPAPWDTESS